jgi:hypothetical protein
MRRIAQRLPDVSADRPLPGKFLWHCSVRRRRAERMCRAIIGYASLAVATGYSQVSDKPSNNAPGKQYNASAD